MGLPHSALCYYRAMQWMNVFHSLIIPFLGGFSLTLTKLIADRKLLSLDQANDIALDMVLLGVGALGAVYIKGGAVEATIDAGIGDAFVAAILLYLRFRRQHLTREGSSTKVGLISGIVQVFLGACAILWTLMAF
jgi:hypothetical protein